MDALLGATTLKSGLCLSHAILDGLDAVPACKRPPRPHSPALQDDVGVDEDRAGVAGHVESQFQRRLDPVRPEELRQIVHR
jgi:hypothetical protein